MPENLHPYVNVENCERLAAYLESLPEDYEHFGMAAFIYPSDPDEVVRYAKKNGGVYSCGTAACAVGHGPAAGILFPEEGKYWTHTYAAFYPDGRGGRAQFSREERVVPDWSTYSGLFVDTREDELWDWCFGPYWSRVDDTPHGAAKRIRYMLSRLNEDDIIPGWGGRPFSEHDIAAPGASKFYLGLYQ